MKIALTGATGFLGRYLAAEFASEGHACRAWFRPSSDRSGFAGDVEWVPGSLGAAGSEAALVAGCDAVVHAALDRPGAGFRGAEGDVIPFVETNVVGTLRLIEAARRAGVGRFVFISSCAVHERILPDRPLDETHPLWPSSHYGAHKAAIEAFVHSYAQGDGFPICALRPTGIYGLAHPAERSKWFELVRAVVGGHPVEASKGGKEVHARDVARAAGLLLRADADRVKGEAFACYDRYVSDFEVATIAKGVARSGSEIRGKAPAPKNEIVTDKLKALGMTFGGRPLLEATVAELVAAAPGL